MGIRQCMRVIETFRNKFYQEEPQWTTEEGLEKLMMLHGQTVNLFTVLQRNRPDHGHYRPNWFPDQQQEPEFLRSAISEVFNWQKDGDPYLNKSSDDYHDYVNRKNTDKKVAELYINYFKQHGIKSIKIVRLLPELFVARRSEKDKIWPARETIALFRWIDFAVNFDMSHATRRQAKKKGNGMALGVNTSKTKGDLYKIDLYAGERREEDALHQFVQGRIATDAIRFYGLPDKEWAADAFVLAKKSQRLITDLLKARV